MLGAFESDASHSKASGLSPRAGLLCLPTLSTHGYEVIARDAIKAVSEVSSVSSIDGHGGVPGGRVARVGNRRSWTNPRRRCSTL